MQYTSDVAFTDTVKRIQAERGSRRSYERMERSIGRFPSAIPPDVAAFIADRDSAYILPRQTQPASHTCSTAAARAAS